DLFAGRVFALLARHRLEERPWIIERGIVFSGIAGRFAAGSRFGVGIVTVNADPVHFAAAHHLILAHHRNIVFGLAGHHTGIATVALVQVDGHAPGIAFVFEFFVKRIVFRGSFPAFVRERRILVIVRERSRAEDLPAFHVEVVLRAGQRIYVTRGRDFAIAGSPQSVRRTHGIRVKAFVRARRSRERPAVAER